MKTMADEPPKPDPEHLARFRKVMTAIVAVPKSEVLESLAKQHKGATLSLNSKGRVVRAKKKRT